MKSIYKFVMAGVSLGAIATPLQSFAQTPQGAAATSASNDEIIVQARRKDESVQDVPAVVNAVTSEQIGKLNIRKFEDIASTVPGLNLSANANGIGVTATVRGVNYDVNASGNNGTVEFYFNDVPTSAGSLFNSLFDVGQVEVLRGPQGTLKGRSSPSGSITMFSKRPDLGEVGGQASLTQTDIRSFNFNGAMNIPVIADKLGVRIAGVYSKDEGNQVRDLVNTTQPSNKQKGIRASVEVDPFEGVFVVDFMFQNLQRDSVQFGQSESVNQVVTSAAASPVTVTAQSLKSVIGLPQTNSQTFDHYNWQAKLSLLGQRLTYVGGRTDQHLVSFAPTDIGGIFSNDFVGATAFGQPTDTFSEGIQHEIRLQNEERIGGIFDYVVGYLHAKNYSDTIFKSVTGIALAPPFAAAPTLVNIALTPIQRYGTNWEDSMYGNVTAHLGDAFEASFGLRHIKYRDVSGLKVNNVENFLFFKDKTESQTVYQGSLKYRFNDDVMVYASTGSSWRPSAIAIGGPTGGLSALQLSYLSTAPETSKSYEIGLKSAWLNKTVHFNITGYQQKFQNYPYRSSSGVYAIDRTNSAAGTVTSFNYIAAVPVKVTGVEAELNYAPNRHFSIGTVLGYADSKITNGLVPCLDLNGDGVPDVVSTAPSLAAMQAVVGANNISSCAANFSATLAPKWSGTVQSEYSHEFSGNMEGYLRGLFSWKGNSLNDPSNAFDDVKGYGLLNLYMGLRDPDGGWELSLYGKNITNTFRVLTRSNGPQATPLRGGIPLGGPVVSSGPITSTYYGITVTEPREFGVTFRVAFGSR